MTTQDPVPARQIRAVFTDDSITVYQAYRDAIADAALEAQRFVPPFRLERMTWIKPSFLWMMYRCGWAGKEGQERVLAVEISRSGLTWALEHACLSHFEPEHHASHAAWEEQKAASPVRVQWDPERSVSLEKLPHRSIQIGLGGEAAERYARDWILGIRDVTYLAHEVRDLVAAGELEAARDRLPIERPYPLDKALAERLGAGQ